MLWKHFAALSALPRPSGHERAAADMIAAFAADRGLAFQRDQAGNVCVRKPATQGNETLAPLVLQAHLDMVPQKTKESTHDFTRDGLTLRVEGDWVRAEGTTLGADNGLGVAAALALLESTDIAHGPLSAVFTVEEEIGLRGAAKVSPSFLDGEFLINLDADNPAELIIGCAGALDLRARLTPGHQPCDPSAAALTVTLGGLAGGHSGADIHRGRGNALLLLARLLAALPAELGWGLAGFSGGDARNAIPREASALVCVSAGSQAALEATLRAQLAAVRNEYALSDPGMTLSLAPASLPSQQLCSLSQGRLLTLLRCCPNGALRFSDLQPGVVETSSNLGILNLAAEGDAELHFLVRSCVDSAKENLGSSIASLVQLAGGSVAIAGNYPGWQPCATSRLVPLFAEACTRRLGREPAIVVVHGGLECGLLKAANPGLDCISFGPVIQNMHSPDERCSISSVQEFWDILTSVVGRLPLRA